MQCPNDGQTLAMTTREGIEIDYCPTCRGVWLDRGELDKLIERSSIASTGVRDAETPEPALRRSRGDGNRDEEYGRGRYGHGDREDRGAYGRPKRRSFLDDLFDFG